MADGRTIPEQRLKVLIPSMLLGVLPFWLLPAFGMDVQVSRDAGWVLGAGIVLLSCAFGLGQHFKSWILAPLAVIGTFLFVVAGTAIIH